eukprot:gene2226-2743_t
MTSTTTTTNKNKYLIPIGYIARNSDDNEQNKEIRFYTDEVTLDSSVFIIKSENRISFFHMDLLSLDSVITVDQFKSEIEYVNNNNNNNCTIVWRCFNIPKEKEAAKKQQEANHEIEMIWLNIKKEFSTSNDNIKIEFKELNILETCSISLSDQVPQLYRISTDDLAPNPVSQKLLNSVSLINKFVSPSIIKNNINNNTTNNNNDNDDNNNKTTTKGINIIFSEGTWVDNEIQKLTKVHNEGLPLLEKDPNLYVDFIDAFVKAHPQLSLTQFIEQLFCKS